MAKRKEDIKEPVSKKAKMLKMVEEEKKLAEKAGEPVMIGRPSDFTDMGRSSYDLTAILGIDLNIYGIKKGVITTLWGETQAGKTTTTVGIIEGLQFHRPDIVIAYFDTEQTLDDVFLDRFPYLNQENIFLFREIKLEAVIDKMREIARENMADVIIWDSYDNTSSKSTLEKSFEEDSQQVMGKAMVLSQGMQEIEECIKKNGQTMLIIQQVKQKFNSRRQAFDGRAGGNTMNHAPSAVLKLSQLYGQSEIEDVDGEKKIVNSYVKIKNEKSKVSQPYLTTHTWVNTDPNRGIAIDRMREVLDYGIIYDIIESGGGGWTTLTDYNGEVIKVQGKEKLIPYFKEDVDLYSHIKLHIYSKGISPEMFIVKFDDIIKMLETENRAMKDKKIELLKAAKKDHLITEKDTKVYKIDTDIFNPKNMLGQEEYDVATFNLMSVEEQKKFLEKGVI